MSNVCPYNIPTNINNSIFVYTLVTCFLVPNTFFPFFFFITRAIRNKSILLLSDRVGTPILAYCEFAMVTYFVHHYGVYDNGKIDRDSKMVPISCGRENSAAKLVRGAQLSARHTNPESHTIGTYKSTST